MLKLPKGLKKKKKGKKSKRKGEDELFTQAELEKYKKEHQHQGDSSEATVKENEEWSKFKNLTTGIDDVLKKTQGDLDRIKSTSFFQRKNTGPREVDSSGQERIVKKAESPHQPVVEVTEADFPQLAAQAPLDDEDCSEYAVTDDESEDDQDDIFDTSYVEAVEKGEVKLTYVSDSPDENEDDDLFDTSHVDALIKGQSKESKTSGLGKKTLNIGVAVEVLTGRIDNVAIPVARRPKRVIPGNLLLDDTECGNISVPAKLITDTVEKSILDVDEEIPINTPIDLSVSLHTSLIKQNITNSQDGLNNFESDNKDFALKTAEDDDEFAQLAAESLGSSSGVQKIVQEIEVKPVLQESWSAFEADKRESVFAEGIIEDQIDVIDPYEDDPFDTSFAEAVIPNLQLKNIYKQPVIPDTSDDADDDFDPRADEVKYKFNNRRKSSVRIHLTDPSGIRESITSDDIHEKEESINTLDLLGGSTTDLSQLGDSPLDPVDINNDDSYDPFDTTIVDKIAAPGKFELKLLEKELIGEAQSRVEDDFDFDPRAEEPKSERRPSRPENLVVGKSVVFNVEGAEEKIDLKNKSNKPVTPYYTREVSITEDLNEESEVYDSVSETLVRTRSNEDLSSKISFQTKRRHSEFSQQHQIKSNIGTTQLLESVPHNIHVKVLTPCAPPTEILQEDEIDPFDTSFASEIAPSKTELKLLAKEFSCEESKEESIGQLDHLLNPTEDEIFQARALSPQPSNFSIVPKEDFDPFDTTFAGDLQPGKVELKLLESEFLN